MAEPSGRSWRRWTRSRASFSSARPALFHERLVVLSVISPDAIDLPRFVTAHGATGCR
jgi:hypothetical protein